MHMAVILYHKPQLYNRQLLYNATRTMPKLATNFIYTWCFLHADNMYADPISYGLYRLPFKFITTIAPRTIALR